MKNETTTHTYRIQTDAGSEEIHAASVNDAVGQFCRSEKGLTGISTAGELLAHFAGFGDGAFVTIWSDDGELLDSRDGADTYAIIGR